MLILSNQYYNYNMKYYYNDTKIGYLTITEEDSAITGILFGKQNLDGEFILSPLIKETFSQIGEYLEGKRKEFNIKINPKGTDFQKKVWQKLCEIPYGQTKTYSQIAEEIKNPKAIRAVGMANNKNPLCIVVPCHRVIGKNGKLIGYAGGIDMKKSLLDIEHKNQFL